MSLTYAPASANVIDKLEFFELLNCVLASLGREPLDVRSAHKSVIEILPKDRVLQILAGPGSGKTEALVWRLLFELFVKGTPSARLLVTTIYKSSRDGTADSSRGTV